MSFTASHSRRSFLTAAILSIATFAISAQTASAAVVLSIPKTYTALPGDTVNISVDLTNDTSIDVAAFGVALSFDSSVFTISNVQPGSLLSGGLLANFASSTVVSGVLTASSFAITELTIPAGTGPLLTFDLTVNLGAGPGAYPINLLANSGSTTTGLENLSGTIPLTPAPTNANNEAVDGLVTVNAIPEPSQYALTGMLVGLAGLRQLWSRRRARAAKG